MPCRPLRQNRPHMRVIESRRKCGCCSEAAAARASHWRNETLRASGPHRSMSTVQARMEARMSSNETIDTTDSGIELWRVQLSTGELRAMSLDALDDAFQAGVINESTPVLPPG